MNLQIGDTVIFEGRGGKQTGQIKELNEVMELTASMVKQYNLKSNFVWKYTCKDGTMRVVGDVSSDKSFSFKELPEEVLKNSKKINQFVWVEGQEQGHAFSFSEVRKVLK